MADLILKTRLDVLRSNLQRVTEIESTESGSVENLRAELQRLLHLPTGEEMTQRLSTIYMLVAEGIKALRYTHDEKTAISRLQSIEDELEAINEYLGHAQEAADLIQSRALVLRGEGGSPWNALQEGLVDNAVKQIDELSQIEDDLLRQAARAAQQGDAATAMKLQKTAWEQYSGTVFRETNKVFCEYLDFLSGLALRDTGLDQGMCRIADRLLRDGGRLPGNFTWDSLTIPAQREALQDTLAKIVRLGFPEWTIWALPLAVHEFGHVAVTIDRIKNVVVQGASDEEDRHRVRVCLADAFATHMMGPAYACAVILLRLDPCRAFTTEDHRLTEKRARVVLAMLKHMNRLAEATEEGAYDAMHDRLESEWNDALLQVGQGDSLTLQEEEEVKSWVELISDTMGPSRALSPKLWPRVEELAELLDPAQVENVKVSYNDELRIVLNAAWKRRMDENDLSRVNEVAEAAVKLWGMIELAQEKGDRYTRPQLQPLGWTSGPVSKPGVPARFNEGT